MTTCTRPSLAFRRSNDLPSKSRSLRAAVFSEAPAVGAASATWLMRLQQPEMPANIPRTMRTIARKCAQLPVWLCCIVAPPMNASPPHLPCINYNSSRSHALVRQKCENRLAILNFPAVNHGKCLFPRHDEIFIFLVRLASRWAGGQPLGDENPHPFAKHARRRKVCEQFFEVRRPISSLFRQFAAGGF